MCGGVIGARGQAPASIEHHHHHHYRVIRPATDPELPPTHACLVNYERYRPLVEALRLGMGPAKHLERCVSCVSAG